MVEIDIAYEGDLHTVCRHGPSGAELATDAPRDNEGRGESFSPTDLLATALGTCMITIMGIHARRNSWPFGGGRVRVEKHMVADPARRVGRLVLHFELPGAVEAGARAQLEKAARTCPVALSVHPDIKLETSFHWGA